jgi:hypothetical protein
MKTSATVLVLLALLALVPCTGMAQPAPTPAVAAVTAVTAVSTAAPNPTETADYQATLTVAPSAATDLAPAPSFMTGCTSNAQCPTGKLCCYPCGIDGCTNMCLTPIKGRCPLFQ